MSTHGVPTVARFSGGAGRTRDEDEAGGEDAAG
jgi:hypothetical protein